MQMNLLGHRPCRCRTHKDSARRIFKWCDRRFLLRMQHENVAALRSTMIGDAKQRRVGTTHLHNAFCLFPLSLCSSSLVAIVNHVLPPVVVAAYLRCIDELLCIFPRRGASVPESVVRIHEYEFRSITSRKRLLMPSFPRPSLVGHRQCRIRNHRLNDIVKVNRRGNHVPSRKATDTLLFMGTHFLKYAEQFRVISAIPVIGQVAAYVSVVGCIAVRQIPIDRN